VGAVLVRTAGQSGQRQQIHASIEARFTISQPTVLAAPLD
jgi:hypothetical protein